MAINTPTILAAGSDVTTSTTHATSSVTPAAGTLTILCIAASNSAGTATEPTGVTGNGLTWTKANGLVPTGGNHSVSVWYAVGAGSAGAITATYAASHTNAQWRVVQIGNVDTTTPIVQTAVLDSTSATPSILLTNNCATGNAMLVYESANSNSGTWSDTNGFTALGTDSAITGRTIEDHLAYLVAAAGTKTYTGAYAGTSRKGLVLIEIADAVVTTKQGSASGAITWGTGSATGKKITQGAASGAVARGPGSATGTAPKKGAASGAIARGPGSATGVSPKGGTASGAVTRGPGSATGLRPSLGSASGAVTRGPGVATGEMPGVPDSTGSASGAITRGPGVATGFAPTVAPHSGSASGAIARGPGVATGHAPTGGPPPSILAHGNGVARPHIDDEGWRYFAMRMNGDGTSDMIDGDVPLRGVSITDVLSGPNGLSGSLDPEYRRFKDDKGRPIFRPWSTAIFAENDGQIYGGGLLLPSSFADNAWSLECTGLTGYPAGQPFTDSEFMVEVDPIDVIRRIWEWLQEQEGANLGLQVADTVSGQVIGVALDQIEYDTQNGPLRFEAGPVKLNWYETHDLGAMLDDFAKNTPCDTHEWHQWQGDDLKHHLDIGYPRLGRRRTDLRFVIGENIALVPNVAEGTDQYANMVLALGAGEGRTMKMALLGRTSPGLRRVAIVEDKRMNTVAKINSFARRSLQNYRGLDNLTEITVRQSHSAAIGSWDIGDEILVQGDGGWKDIEVWCRIVSSTISPDDSDNAVLTLVSEGNNNEDDE